MHQVSVCKVSASAGSRGEAEACRTDVEKDGAVELLVDDVMREHLVVERLRIPVGDGHDGGDDGGFRPSACRDELGYGPQRGEALALETSQKGGKFSEAVGGVSALLRPDTREQRRGNWERGRVGKVCRSGLLSGQRDRDRGRRRQPPMIGVGRPLRTGTLKRRGIDMQVTRYVYTCICTACVLR